MYKIGFYLLLLIVISGGVFFIKDKFYSAPVIVDTLPKSLPLQKYSFPNLKRRLPESGTIVLGKKVKEDENFCSYHFHFYSGGKKVTGMANVPTKEGIYPVIIMIRGYVDHEIYETGDGTMHGVEVLAQNGFITLAPDFLGYGGSDMPSADAMEERFQTYTTVEDLIGSVKNLQQAIRESTSSAITADTEKIGLWGHSNGGQIALSTLEITGGNYPTVLWAPVSKPFPYSILYYTDDYDDFGKALRKVVANFELNYDADKYSIVSYYDWIGTPIQLHQGQSDESVPQKWSDDLYNSLKEKKKDIEYFTYPGEDHNFDKGNWNQTMGRTIEFYKKRLAGRE